MLHIQHLSPSIAGTLAAPIVRSHNCVIPFIVQNDIKMWLMIQNFVAITKSATLDPQQLSQAPSLWLEKHHIAVLNQTQKSVVIYGLKPLSTKAVIMSLNVLLNKRWKLLFSWKWEKQNTCLSISGFITDFRSGFCMVCQLSHLYAEGLETGWRP